VGDAEREAGAAVEAAAESEQIAPLATARAGVRPRELERRVDALVPLLQKNTRS